MSVDPKLLKYLLLTLSLPLNKIKMADFYWPAMIQSADSLQFHFKQHYIYHLPLYTKFLMSSCSSLYITNTNFTQAPFKFSLQNNNIHERYTFLKSLFRNGFVISFITLRGLEALGYIIPTSCGKPVLMSHFANIRHTPQLGGKQPS